jgi:hypothetical protein
VISPSTCGIEASSTSGGLRSASSTMHRTGPSPCRSHHRRTGREQQSRRNDSPRRCQQLGIEGPSSILVAIGQNLVVPIDAKQLPRLSVEVLGSELVYPVPDVVDLLLPSFEPWRGLY